MSTDEFEKLKTDHNSSPPKGYSYVKDTAFVKKLCEAQYKSSKGNKKDGEKCKVTRNACQKKSKCFLVPKSEDEEKCCPGQTGHHLLPDTMLKEGVGEAVYSKDVHEGAPTVCVAGGSHSKGTHGLMHLATKKEYDPSDSSKMSYEDACDASLAAHKKVFKKSNCDYACMKNKLNEYYSDDVKNGSYSRKGYGSGPIEAGSSWDHMKEIIAAIGKKIGAAVDLLS